MSGILHVSKLIEYKMQKKRKLGTRLNRIVEWNNIKVEATNKIFLLIVALCLRYDVWFGNFQALWIWITTPQQYKNFLIVVPHLKCPIPACNLSTILALLRKKLILNKILKYVWFIVLVVIHCAEKNLLIKIIT